MIRHYSFATFIFVSYSFQVTINVINTVNNVLHVSDDDFEIAIDAEAPTRILDSLENQLTLFQTQGDGSNLTVVDESLAVVALNIPRTTLQEGLGFTTQGGVRSEVDVYNDALVENSTMVFYDVDEIPVTEFEAAVIIPSGVLDSISFNNLGIYSRYQCDIDIDCGSGCRVGIDCGDRNNNES